MEQSNEPAVDEAIEMARELEGFANQHGWRSKIGPKANKKYGFVTLVREYQQEDGDLVQEELRAFYAIDPDSETDQVTHVDADGTTTVLDPETGDVRAAVERQHPAPSSAPAGDLDNPGPRGRETSAVPPTSAFADAAHHEVEEMNEASRDALLSAAHLDEHGIEHNDMRTDAAHQDESRGVPPIRDVDYGGLEPLTPGAGIKPGVPDPTRGQEPTGETVTESFKIVPPADPAEVAAEACLHTDAAKRDGNDVYSQQELYGAVRQQQVNLTRNWSSVASDMSSDEILVRLGVNRKANNRVDITWLNSLSGTLDRATCDGSAERHAPHITPKGFDPAEHGEDLRILHFLEVNGGFRSVAVARIRKFG